MWSLPMINVHLFRKIIGSLSKVILLAFVPPFYSTNAVREREVGYVVTREKTLLQGSSRVRRLCWYTNNCETIATKLLLGTSLWGFRHSIDHHPWQCWPQNLILCSRSFLSQGRLTLRHLICLACSTNCSFGVKCWLSRAYHSPSVYVFALENSPA